MSCKEEEKIITALVQFAECCVKKSEGFWEKSLFC